VNCGAEYDACLAAGDATGRSMVELECEAFGITHEDAGMYLLRLWGLSDAVTAAVALHHRPNQSPDRSLTALGIVHAANVLVRNPEAPAAAFDLAYLTRVNALAALLDWQKLARRAIPESVPMARAMPAPRTMVAAV
jgi:hypothetical protein